MFCNGLQIRYAQKIKINWVWAKVKFFRDILQEITFDSNYISFCYRMESQTRSQ